MHKISNFSRIIVRKSQNILVFRSFICTFAPVFIIIRYKKTWIK